jgi:hypothetical protein
MPLMNSFEPLFLLLALVTLATLVTSAIFLVSGRAARAGRILRRLAIGAALYFAVVILASIVSPRTTYRVGDTQCFDDWCITVAAAGRPAAPPDTAYDVRLTLSNRARRVPMGEKGTVVYLVDAAGTRYDPAPDSSAPPIVYLD